MTKNRATKLSALSVIAASALIVACGGVPSSDVATVADSGISKTVFNKWMFIAARSQSQGSTSPTVVPIPPKFEACKAALMKQVPAGLKNKPTPAQAESQCKSMFNAQKGQVMQLLITSAWIEGQARAMGIDVSEAAVRKQFEQTKKQAFPDDAAYRKFLKQAGETEKDILFRMRIDLLSTKIKEAVLKNAGKISDQDISDYYAKNRQEFGQAEKRDILVVRTESKASAEAAKAALASGQSWAAVVKKYSNDPDTKKTGGLKKDATQSNQDPAFGKAAFAAKTNVVVGPIQGALGWYVAKVTKVTAGSSQPLPQVKAVIKQKIKAQKEQTALTSFVKEFQSKWKARTECAKDYIVELCGNAPKQPAAASSPGPGTVQQTPPPSGG